MLLQAMVYQFDFIFVSQYLPLSLPLFPHTLIFIYFSHKWKYNLCLILFESEYQISHNIYYCNVAYAVFCLKFLYPFPSWVNPGNSRSHLFYDSSSHGNDFILYATIIADAYACINTCQPYNYLLKRLLSHHTMSLSIARTVQFFQFPVPSPVPVNKYLDNEYQYSSSFP